MHPANKGIGAHNRARLLLEEGEGRHIPPLTCSLWKKLDNNCYLQAGFDLKWNGTWALGLRRACAARTQRSFNTRGQLDVAYLNLTGESEVVENPQTDCVRLLSRHSLTTARTGQQNS